jgi:hypothetical protein
MRPDTDSDESSQGLNRLYSKVMGFLGHLHLSETCTNLHRELQEQYAGGAESLNTTRLEELLELVVATSHAPLTIENVEVEAIMPVTAEKIQAWTRPPGSGGIAKDLSTQDPIELFERLSMNEADGSKYLRFGRQKAHDKGVVFHTSPPMSSGEQSKLVVMNLPLIYNPHKNGLEDERELRLVEGLVIGGRYAALRSPCTEHTPCGLLHSLVLSILGHPLAGTLWRSRLAAAPSRPCTSAVTCSIVARRGLA